MSIALVNQLKLMEPVSYLTLLVQGENLLISIFYLVIAIGITYSIWCNRATGIDLIVVAMAGIFFSCGLGHSLHAAHMFGLSNIMLWQAAADMITVIVAASFLSFYGSFSLLTRFSQIVASEAELQIQNKKLEEILAELRNTQLQLIQHEKMSSLGNLVSGVAHEINNPTGCIVGNIDVAEQYIRDLLEVINLYQKEFPHCPPKFEAELEAFDLEYLRQDLPKLIQSMKDGGDRIKSISNSLRTFSRADHDTKLTFSVHDGIDSTVLILRHRLKANQSRPEIKIITNYGEIPPIACFPGQLNQVFMNILANAIDIFDEMAQGVSFDQLKSHPQNITIRTTTQANQVQIQIGDNGKGMTEEVRTRIFDHLFTTKGVGKGTGLGLAIARQIVVEKHGGKISCNSSPGIGTEFMIEIPLS
jgi:signal transduction histidine kinase